MNFIKSYIGYLKDNPEGYWFKRKLFGWGWAPARWQGWVVTLLFIALILWIGLDFESQTKTITEPTNATLGWFFAKILVSIVALSVIAWKTGEPPKWMWGIPKKIEENKE